MGLDVLCLRPLADFQRVDALPPSTLSVEYRDPNDADVPELMKQARALLIPAVGPKLPPQLFQGTTVCFVQVTGAGLDRLDAATLKGQGVAVANVPGGSNNAVAEYVVTAASLLLRRFAWADTQIRLGRYTQSRARMLADNLRGLDGLLVGVVGFGIIGRAVAEKFHAMGCRICFYDPASSDPAAGQRMGARSLSLEEVLSDSDVVTLHVPLLPSTKNMIGNTQLEWMKPGAILIQASRGGIVDEAALAHHLISGHLAGAAVDVYSTEPADQSNPLFEVQGDAASRLLFTPHIAGVTRQSAAFLFRNSWRNLERVLLENAPPENRVY